jgi:transposase
MPKRITIAPHISLEELEQRYRQSKDATQRSHYQILWLLAQGRSTQEVAQVTGYSRGWIYELVWGYNRDGADSLGDGRQKNPGAMPILDVQQQANLLQVLRGPSPDGGLWNGRKVADYLSEMLERPISRQQGWVYLKQLGWRVRVPRPQHQDSDPEQQEEWKKKLHQTVEQVKAEHPDAAVEVWCEDEHRIGLSPVTRQVWVEEGEQPVALVNWKREWLWLYGFVEPKTGETYWWILPYVRTDLFSQVLKDFAEHFGVGKTKRVVLPLDQAGWHVSQDLEVPEGIHLVLMPPYSPELQPAERLWPLINEPLANQAFESITEVEELVYQRCLRLFNQTELIRGLTSYYWWPDIHLKEVA